MTREVIVAILAALIAGLLVLPLTMPQPQNGGIFFRAAAAV